MYNNVYTLDVKIFTCMHVYVGAWYRQSEKTSMYLEYIFKQFMNNSPMRGILEAAGGVDSARSRRRTKNATKMFIPVMEHNNKLVLVRYIYDFYVDLFVGL